MPLRRASTSLEFHRHGAVGVRGLGARHVSGGPLLTPSVWPAAPRGTPWREMDAHLSAEPQRDGTWLHHLFGCLSWRALAGARGLASARMCDVPMGQAGHCELMAVEMVRCAAQPPQPDAAVFLWFIDDGALTVSSEDGDQVRYGPGSLLLSDGMQALHSRWMRARVHFLRLPRHRVMDALSQDATPALQGVMRLDHLGLASLLGTQLRLLQQQGPAMPESELNEMLSLLFGTAEGLIRLALPLRRAPTHEGSGGKLSAVHRYIEKNLHRHDLNAQQIALGINSSRAQLYRLFDGQPLSVHGTVREARLRKSVEYLRNCGGDALSIGAIAYACGFSDQSVFSKLFRQRYGTTPTELRNRLGPAAVVQG